MNIVYGFYRFYLDYNLVFDEEINPVSAVQFYVLVNNREPPLLLYQ